MIDQCSGPDKVPDNCIRLFSHILNAHHIWNQRILGNTSDYGVWDLHMLERWEDIHYDNQRTTFEILSGTDALENRVEYTNSAGKVFTNEVKDILFHIINHSTNHRGQMMRTFRDEGLTPEPLDYINYKR